MQLSQQTIKTLKKYKPYLHTITSDNGKEFAMHQAIAKELDIQYYFTHPYSSYECGTVENTNGLIRRYIPPPLLVFFTNKKPYPHEAVIKNT